MVVNRGRQYREVEQIPKSHPSSDCRLKPACMKLESLVIADQPVSYTHLDVYKRQSLNRAYEVSGNRPETG